MKRDIADTLIRSAVQHCIRKSVTYVTNTILAYQQRIMYLPIASCLVLGLAYRGAAGASIIQRAASSCRHVPGGDAEWPPQDAWHRLNSTVSGRLIATVPVAHVCHSPDFSPAGCSKVRELWGLGVSHDAGFLVTLDERSSAVSPAAPRTACMSLADSFHFVNGINS